MSLKETAKKLGLIRTIEEGATKNESNDYLTNRKNHKGSQPASTIMDTQNSERLNKSLELLFSMVQQGGSINNNQRKWYNLSVPNQRTTETEYVNDTGSELIISLMSDESSTASSINIYIDEGTSNEIVIKSRADKQAQILIPISSDSTFNVKGRTIVVWNELRSTKPDSVVNLISDPYITDDSNWQNVSGDEGSSFVYGVSDPDGGLNATEVHLKGSTNNHVFFDLPELLEVGARYLASVQVKIGPTGFNGDIDIDYYDGGNNLEGDSFTPTEDWQTFETEFIAPEAPLEDPSIRLIGWGNGQDGDSLVIGRVELIKLAGPSGLYVDHTEPNSFSVQSFSTSNVEPTLSLTPDADKGFESFLDSINAENRWGEDKTSIIDGDQDFGEDYFRVSIAANTSSPSDTGSDNSGTGWEAPVINDLNTYRASFGYKVRFKEGFDFVKGGKLPGLYGGDSPSGGANADNGFTLRMMWRENGQGELYAYYPNRVEEYGDSIGRGMFNFTPGQWHHIEQEVSVNTFDRYGEPKADGFVRIWFDGQPVFEVHQLVLARHTGINIAGVMSTIFFGGSDSSWRTPEDTYIEYGDMRIWNSETAS